MNMKRSDFFRSLVRIAKVSDGNWSTAQIAEHAVAEKIIPDGSNPVVNLAISNAVRMIEHHDEPMHLVVALEQAWEAVEP